MSGFFMLMQNDSDMGPHVTAGLLLQGHEPYPVQTPMPKNGHTLLNEEEGARKRRKTGTEELDKPRGSTGSKPAIAEEEIHATGEGKGNKRRQARLRRWKQKHVTALETMNKAEQEAPSMNDRPKVWWDAWEEAGNTALEIVKAQAAQIGATRCKLSTARTAYTNAKTSRDIEAITKAKKELDDAVTRAANQEQSETALELIRLRGALRAAKSNAKKMINGAETYMDEKQEELNKLEQSIKDKRCDV
jgi:hypothetical protein